MSGHEASWLYRSKGSEGGRFFKAACVPPLRYETPLRGTRKALPIGDRDLRTSENMVNDWPTANLPGQSLNVSFRRPQSAPSGLASWLLRIMRPPNKHKSWTIVYCTIHAQTTYVQCSSVHRGTREGELTGGRVGAVATFRSSSLVYLLARPRVSGRDIVVPVG